MFNKAQQAKDLLKMRSQAKKLQKELQEVTETVEKDEVKVTVSADQKIKYLEVSGEERKDIVDAINDAFKKVQKKAAKRMMETGGLSSLLGGGM